MMLNKFENYQQQQQQQQQQQRCSGVVIPTPPTPPQTMQCSADYAAAAAAASKAERESIHSGQFMVSHFEAEEAQDDLEEYDEVKMLDPEDPNLSKHDDPATPCMEVQLYVPRHVSHSQEQGVSSSMVTSHLEIETSLTKLFKCMNLAYSQKLTSPKWNHFKGVRLRWKDKIRLNNVIWRCWHMQFILKRRTPVCQFASPLDVDIHSNPQAVVLEGKYWKRQTTVIKAEYRKWRRNYKSKATGCLIYDTKSELDFLEWSPLNDRTLMISEDWTSDTLFSSINGPFPFPDPREIARGAGIADFMQPGLSSLQPNIDDIDLTIDELLQTSRLPPVPEEGADEMLKSVDYGFSAIMGSDQMDSNSIIDVSANSVGQLSGNDDTNMLDLNTPLGTMQFSDAEQQFVVRESGNSSFIDAQTTNRTMGLAHTMISDERTSALLAEAVATVTTATTRPQNKHFAATNDNIGGRHNNNEFPSKSVMKGRISKSFQRPFRREPHNYDKAQPTMHQTTIYQQMLAEQQKSQQTLQQHLQPVISSFQQAIACQQQQQQQQQLQYSSNQYQTVQNMLDGGSNSNNYSGYSGDITSSLGGTTRVGNSVANVPGTNAKPKNYNVVQTGSNVSTTNLNSTVASTPGQGMLLNVKTEPDVLSMYNLAGTNEVYGSGGGGGSVSNNGSNNLNSYKPYPSVGSFKKSASTGTYINVRVSPNAYMQEQATTSHMHAQSLPLSLGTQVPLLPSALQLQAHAQGQLSPTSSQHHHRQQQQQQQQQPHLGAQQQMQQRQQTTNSIMPKEMFRSNSLPLNVTLQKLDVRSSHDNFAVPKYHAKSNKPRSRSNSIHQHIIGNNGVGGNNSNNGLMVSSQLQAATSDPMLNNSTLAQLLTTSSRKTALAKQQSSSTSAISTLNMPMTTVPMPAAAAAAVTIPVSKIQNVNVSGSKYFMSPPQCSPILSPLMGSLATTGATATPPETLQRQSTQIQQQQKSPKKSASLPTPVATPLLHSPPSKMLSYPPTAGAHTAACTNTISLSPDSFHDQDSPLSPTHSLKFPRENQRRAGHIHAEQKRRYNIKNGFDVLHSLIPQLQQNPNAKLSKAAMLQKGADHIKHLRSERNQLNDRMDALLKERDALNNSLTHLHSILPANGAPVTRQGTEHVRQLYEQYVRHRTLENWKFWILGLILEPLLSSYTASVSSASMEELRRTAFLWVDQHCSLVDLRPAVSNKLKYLSMKTDILSDPPSTLQEEVAKAVNNTTGQHPNLHGT